MNQAPILRRCLAAFGALACGVSVAMAAYASHGLEGQAAERVGMAALFAFGHGLALLLLAPAASGRLRLLALAALCAGTCLFAGTLAGAALFALPTTLAPAGGLLLMLGWLMIAGDALRR